LYTHELIACDTEMSSNDRSTAITNKYMCYNKVNDRFALRYVHHQPGIFPDSIKRRIFIFIIAMVNWCRTFRYNFRKDMTHGTRSYAMEVGEYKREII